MNPIVSFVLTLIALAKVVGSSELLYNSHDVQNPSPLPDAISPESYTVYFHTNVLVNNANGVDSTAAAATTAVAEPIVVYVNRTLSPRGSDRLYSLVKDNYFTNATFFRLVPNFVVQFGIAAEPVESSKWNTNIIDDKVLHTNAMWTMTYAKTNSPNTRSTQLFINYADNGFLDKQGFAPFGTVVSGHQTLLTITNPTPGTSGGISQSNIYTHGTEWVLDKYPNTNYITHAYVIVPTPTPSVRPTTLATLAPSARSTQSPTRPPIGLDISCLSTCTNYNDIVDKDDFCYALVTNVFLDCNSYALSKGTCPPAPCASSCSASLLCQYSASLVYDCFTIYGRRPAVGRNSTSYHSLVDTCVISYHNNAENRGSDDDDDAAADGGGNEDDDDVAESQKNELNRSSKGSNTTVVIVVILIIILVIGYMWYPKMFKICHLNSVDIDNRSDRGAGTRRDPDDAQNYNIVGTSSEHGFSEDDRGVEMRTPAGIGIEKINKVSSI